MEGYLKKWVNLVVQWKDRYFILHEDCLIYSDVQGGRKKGTIHLKIADITQVPQDPLKIVINSGTKQIEVRAPNVEQTIKWFNAIKDAQIKAREADNLEAIPKLKKILSDSNQKKVEKMLVDAFEAGARFDLTLSELLPLISNEQSISTLVDRLQDDAHFIKNNLKECFLRLENQRQRIFRAAQVLENEFNDDPQSEFISFASDKIIDDEESEYVTCLNEGSIEEDPPSIPIQIQNPSRTSLIDYFYKKCPIKHRLLTSNPAYLQSSIEDAPMRLTLPVTKDPNEKINVWKIVSDLKGKDLTNFAVPG